MITYDETKRQTNLVKHGLDLADAALVYNAANKVTLQSPRDGESRQMDIALFHFSIKDDATASRRRHPPKY